MRVVRSSAGGSVRGADQGAAHPREAGGAQDLAARLRVSWEARQGRDERDEAPPAKAAGNVAEPETALSLADRLRAAAQGIDPAALAEAAAPLQRIREAEERQRAQEAERLKEQEKLQEQQRNEGRCSASTILSVSVNHLGRF